SRAVLQQARLDELRGERLRAADGYLRAFELGERRSGLLLRLLPLLVDQGREGEADQILRKFQQIATPQGELARVGAEVAASLASPERVKVLARGAFPESSRDYRNWLWLGQVLAQAGDDAATEQAFRQALSLQKQVP